MRSSPINSFFSLLWLSPRVKRIFENTRGLPRTLGDGSGVNSNSDFDGALAFHEIELDRIVFMPYNVVKLDYGVF